MAYRPNIKNADGSLTDLPIEAETAVKLKSSRSIGLSGVTAIAQSFNGTSAITIPITSVPASLLTGTGNIDISGTAKNADTVDGKHASDFATSNQGASSDSHIANTALHVTASEKEKLNGIQPGAQVNTITGIKGNNETKYRTGNVNLTAYEIGAAYINHQHSAGDMNWTEVFNWQCLFTKYKDASSGGTLSSYIRFDDGFTIQWGYYTPSGSSGGMYRVNFRKSFTDLRYTICTTYVGGEGTGNFYGWVFSYSKETTGFTHRGYGGNPTQWIAIGYTYP